MMLKNCSSCIIRKRELPLKPFFQVKWSRIYKFSSNCLYSVFLLSWIPQANHLVGLKRNYLKLSFNSVNDLIKVKRLLMSKVRKNRERENANTTYTSLLARYSKWDSSTVNKVDRVTHFNDFLYEGLSLGILSIKRSMYSKASFHPCSETCWPLMWYCPSEGNVLCLIFKLGFQTCWPYCRIHLCLYLSTKEAYSIGFFHLHYGKLIAILILIAILALKKTVFSHGIKTDENYE